MGTCKMGNNAMSVVDDRLRFQSIAGSRLIDASIVPTIAPGNTNAPTVMILEKGICPGHSRRRRSNALLGNNFANLM